MQDDLGEKASRRPMLACEEVDRRKAVLTRLQDALAARSVESVLVGRRTLTLRGDGPAPSRPGDPELHVLAADRHRVVTTDGRHYRLADGRMHPADDPSGAAGCILPTDTGNDDDGRQALAPAGRDGAIGAGERALRSLRDDGVI
jgi:hypothetical protein